MSFPSIPLEPINRIAGCMFGRRKPEVVEELEESVQSAKNIYVKLSLEREKIKLKEAKERNSIILRQQQAAHLALQKRIELSNNENVKFFYEFKKVCKERMGMEKYMELINETNHRLGIVRDNTKTQ